MELYQAIIKSVEFGVEVLEKFFLRLILLLERRESGYMLHQEYFLLRKVKHHADEKDKKQEQQHSHPLRDTEPPGTTGVAWYDDDGVLPAHGVVPPIILSKRLYPIFFNRLIQQFPPKIQHFFGVRAYAKQDYQDSKDKSNERLKQTGRRSSFNALQPLSRPEWLDL